MLCTKWFFRERYCNWYRRLGGEGEGEEEGERKEEGEREEDRRRGWEIEEMTSGNSSGQPESHEGEPRTCRFKDQFGSLL